MPLLDHFRPPVKGMVDWNSFHSNWATRIADQLVECLPDEYSAEEHTKASGGVEIDVTSYRLPGHADHNGHVPAGAAGGQVGWLPPPSNGTIPGVFPDDFEVRVIRLSGGRHLVGAIELVSPGNKDAEDVRRAFATKVANYLHSGVSVIVIDVVTERKANLHNETMRLLGTAGRLELPPGTDLYAVAYRPALRNADPVIDLWFANFSVGDPLPTMPLRLTKDLFVPVDFEAAYVEACRRRKLIA